jgi:hypothetical protein
MLYLESGVLEEFAELGDSEIGNIPEMYEFRRSVSHNKVLAMACFGDRGMMDRLRGIAIGGVHPEDEDLRKCLERYDTIVRLLRRRMWETNILIIHCGFSELSEGMGINSVLIKNGNDNVTREMFGWTQIITTLRSIDRGGDIDHEVGRGVTLSHDIGDKCIVGFEVSTMLNGNETARSGIVVRSRVLSTNYKVERAVGCIPLTCVVCNMPIDDDGRKRVIQQKRVADRQIVNVFAKDGNRIYATHGGHRANRIAYSEEVYRDDVVSRFGGDEYVSSIIDRPSDGISAPLHAIAIYERQDRSTNDGTRECRIRVLSMERIMRNVYSDWDSSAECVDTVDGLRKVMQAVRIAGILTPGFTVVMTAGIVIERCINRAHIRSTCIISQGRMRCTNMHFELKYGIFDERAFGWSLREIMRCR